jgi:hypothetical protein
VTETAMATTRMFAAMHVRRVDSDEGSPGGPETLEQGFRCARSG